MLNDGSIYADLYLINSTPVLSVAELSTPLEIAMHALSASTVGLIAGVIGMVVFPKSMPNPSNLFAGFMYWPYDHVGDNFVGMERNTLWFADETGYAVHVRHGIRIVHRFRLETGDLPLAEIRMLAAARAVELALEYRIDLANVSEAREWL